MKHFRLICLTVPLALAVTHASAQPANPAYPAKVVRIVVPSTTGGGADTMARMLAHHLSERWGRQVVVENRTGASNMIAYEFVAKRPRTAEQGPRARGCDPVAGC